MRARIIDELKHGFVLFSVIFAVTTLISSALQLLRGQPTDTNFHILNRAAIVLIAVITILLFDKIRLKNRFLSYLVPYAISLAVVMAYVWLTGFVEPLHPDAYRDVFLNFTAVAIVVIIAIAVRDRIMQSRGRSDADDDRLRS